MTSRGKTAASRARWAGTLARVIARAAHQAEQGQHTGPHMAPVNSSRPSQP